MQQYESNLPANTTTVAVGNYHTIILTDMARMVASPAEVAALQAKLATFAARPEVAGVVVDVDSDARVAAADGQADVQPGVPEREKPGGERDQEYCRPGREE